MVAERTSAELLLFKRNAIYGLDGEPIEIPL